MEIGKIAAPCEACRSPVPKPTGELAPSPQPTVHELIVCPLMLPAESVHGRKRGFSIPAAAWLRGPMAPLMREVLSRRFGRLVKAEAEAGDGHADWPDLVLIDGGAGQLSAARATLQDLGVNDVPLVAIAKGPDRDAGREWFHMDGVPPFQLPPRDPVLYYLQRLRDEAHRFAISTHRTGRTKSLMRSELDEIAGIGAARKRALLNHFGSARGVKQAGLPALEAAPGISREIARRVYAHFHPGVRMDEG